MPSVPVQRASSSLVTTGWRCASARLGRSNACSGPAPEMHYRPTEIAGVTIMDIEPRCDHRGFFARSFCANEFAGCGLNSDMVRTSILYNHARGTLRGLHRQLPPHAEAKLVRCTSGAIVDVAVDVRPDSRTYGKHVMVRLTAKNHRSLFLPPYVAHGFQTLLDHTEVLYQVSGLPTRERARISLGRSAVRNRMATAGDCCFREGRQLAVAAAGRERGLMTGADRAMRRGDACAVSSNPRPDRDHRGRCVSGGKHADRAGSLIDIEFGAARRDVRFNRELNRPIPARPDRGTPPPRSGRPLVMTARGIPVAGTGQQDGLRFYQHGSAEMIYRGTWRRAKRRDTTKRGFNALSTM